MGTTPPPTRQVTWLGGRRFDVKDYRDIPGHTAFIVTSTDNAFFAIVKKDTEHAAELSELLEDSTP